MDIFDVSSLEPPYVGQLKQVKVLGGLAMIDVCVFPKSPESQEKLT